MKQRIHVDSVTDPFQITMSGDVGCGSKSWEYYDVTKVEFLVEIKIVLFVFLSMSDTYEYM